ncbi:peptidoglycan-binding protein [Christensenellaceae bacterium OttesenSCG-928-M15]|nr:peptidoglycan-binding protein [Christensenellaceae bacterium OttesenSCG-928-M15]
MGFVYVFDHEAQDWVFYDDMKDAIPVRNYGIVPLKAFKNACGSDMAWTDARALEALALLLIYASPHTLQYGFRRVEEKIHIGQSAHYAGLAFHVGKGLSMRQQVKVARLALDVCGFDRVEPLIATPGWVHVEKTVAPPSNMSGGYPVLQMGDKGVHVMLLQDVLHLHVERAACALTGSFTEGTALDVRRFQKIKKMPVTGIVDSATWQALLQSYTGMSCMKKSQKTTGMKMKRPLL